MGKVLKPSAALSTLRTCVRSTAPPTVSSTASRGADGPEDDQPPAGDLPVHKAVRGQVRLPADGPRDREGGGARIVIDRARPPGEPREVRGPATRSHEAEGHRAAVRQGQEGRRDG